MEQKKLNIPFQSTRSNDMKTMEKDDKNLVIKMNISAEMSENTEVLDKERDLEISRDALLEQIRIAQEELERRKQHSKRIEELNRAVEEWKADFARALENIQDTFAFGEQK